MGFLTGLLKLSAKGGIVVGTFYFTVEQGVWKETNEALKIYERLKSEASDIDKYIPGASKHLERINPQKGIFWSISAHKPLPATWNHGVYTTFKFLDRLPENITQYSYEAKNKVSEMIK
ncbi:MICOS complex subunit MIC13 homolog QIL1-like [Artemia franciscana]|uniref:MICOS complex subunit MIC13 n=1 Tax=Artemia franciscana TaxID=6661 RepID=A0AA88H8S7_ARTSF|nr:hypothetical protein QYM36_016655 [Artemia franciscana]